MLKPGSCQTSSDELDTSIMQCWQFTDLYLQPQTFPWAPDMGVLHLHLVGISILMCHWHFKAGSLWSHQSSAQVTRLHPPQTCPTVSHIRSFAPAISSAGTLSVLCSHFQSKAAPFSAITLRRITWLGSLTARSHTQKHGVPTWLLSFSLPPLACVH